MSYRNTTGGFGWDVGNHTNYEDDGEYSGSSYDKGDKWKIYDEHDEYAGFSRKENDDLIYHYDWDGKFIGKSVRKSGDRWDDYDANCDYIGTHRDGYPGRPVKEMYSHSYYDSDSGSSGSSYSSSSYDSSGSSGSSGGGGGFGFSLLDSIGDTFSTIISISVLAIFAVLVFCVIEGLAGLGVIKAKTEFTLIKSGYDEAIEKEAILAIDATTKNKSYYYSLDESGTTTIKLHEGTYIFGLESDGAGVYSDVETISVFYNYTFDLDSADLYDYVFHFYFVDIYGNELNPEAVYISFDSGESKEATKSGNSEWIYLVQGDYDEEGIITISADGYESVEIEYDTLYRTNSLKVTLTEVQNEE